DFHPPPGRAYRVGGALRLLAAGRVSVEKGFSDLLVAVRRLVAGGFTSVHLDIAGDGPGLSELRTFVSGHGLDAQVELLGRLSHEALIARMSRADALVLTSRPVGNWAET